jgi:S1-C subfamily serine protease
VDYFDNEYEEASSTSGLIVANNDVELLILVSLNRIEDAKKIKVTFSDYLEVDASLQGYDSDLNLAVISIKLEDIPQSKMNSLTPATLGESFALSVGTPILALGNPNGYVGSMEMGMITSFGSSSYITDDEIDLFNTDVAYNENGDGVIVNMKGEVIGIITNELKGELNQNINTAIGISRIKKTIESLVSNTERVYFGIKAADMTESALEKADIENGICITEVEVDSPALLAGLQNGDIITALNDTPVMSVNSFQSIISIYKPKTSVKVTISRNTKGKYKNKEIQVVLAKKKS